MDFGGIFDLEGGEEFISKGKFIMLFEYEESTGFFPTAQTRTIRSVGEYMACDDLASVQIPALTLPEVIERCLFVWDKKLCRTLI